MFLKQIKIVGFKSFVEPTIIYFKSNRIAIVGPNGCGKSNVIDAIRWVMGESSPKFLRGDLMADVIFNGSLSRKPQGLASVEIILDNHAAYLKGAYVVKGDVSLKREVNRAGESSYFINNQKVRRKDLTDLWLGTGAGARGYAIIGQNMVNHLVEANPEVLRGYLEEAAGVSKYKERRRESSERLSQVTENLQRLSDIIFELKAHLERLEKESHDAQHYHQLRKQLREFEEAAILAKARDLNSKYEINQQFLAECLVQEELLLQQQDAKQQTLLDLEKNIFLKQNELQTEEQQLFKRELEAEQHEKLVLQRIQEKEHYLQEIKQIEQDLTEITQQLEVETQNLVLQKEELHRLNEINTSCEQEILGLKEKKHILKQKYHTLNQERMLIRQKQQQYKTEHQVILAKQDQAQQNLLQYQDQIRHWQTLLKEQDISFLEKNLKQFLDDLSPKEILLKRMQQVLSNLQEEFFSLSNDFNVIKTEKNLAQQEVDHRSRESLHAQASYEGLLANFKDESADMQEISIAHWLQSSSIPEEMQAVVDWLWQHFLPSIINHISEDNLPSTGFFGALTQMDFHESLVNLPRLISLIGKNDYPASFISWPGIMFAPDLSTAFKFRKLLNLHESIITSEGIWMGKDWLYVLPIQSEKSAGLATRFNAFKTAQRELRFAEENLIQKASIFADFENKYLRLKDNIESNQKDIENLINEINSHKQLYQTKQQELKFIVQEHSRNQQELIRCEEKYAFITGQLKDWKRQIELIYVNEQDLESQEQKFSDELETYHQEMTNLDIQLSKKNEFYDTNKTNQVKIKIEYDFYLQNIPKSQVLIEKHKVRQNQLQQIIMHHGNDSNFTPDYFENIRHAILNAKTNLNSKKEILMEVLQQRQVLVNQIEQGKQQQLHLLEKKWKATAEKEQLSLDLEKIKQELTADFSSKLWQNLPIKQDEKYFKRLIVEKENQINLLGDVNLLAVGLFEQEKNRYENFLLQEKDLQQAMHELKIAINTLDNDMQIQLQTTLTAINQQLLIIFPKLFGGGEAKFVPSCDNLLEANVSVQVQLPGKKQHRIQLLSGGEKALTAVALLFAIFALNPAPFCLLDEVDAALDDANVLRLAALIKEMSQTVQFIIITHNPLSMDVADELVGVTMQEPGISRVVAVNMAMALAMVNKE